MARNKAATAEEKSAEEIEPANGESTAKGPDGSQLPPLAPAHVVIRKGQGRRPRTMPAKAEPMERVDPPTAKRYMVVKGGRITGNGLPQTLNTGKPITDVEYDIDSLIQQGIELREVADAKG